MLIAFLLNKYHFLRSLLISFLIQVTFQSDEELCEAISSFQPVLEIPTSGSAGFEYFSLAGSHFLLAANFFKQNSIETHSKLYKLSLDPITLVELWKIRTQGAHGSEYWNICHSDSRVRHYFAIPNYYGEFTEVLFFVLMGKSYTRYRG